MSVILSSADGISFAVNEEWIGMNAMDVEFEIKWDRKRYNAIEKERENSPKNGTHWMA